MYTWVNFLQFLHVTAVIVWVGGAATLSILNARLGKAGERDALAALGRQSRWFGAVVLSSSAAITLVTGIWMVLASNRSFDDLWIAWGFVAIAGSLVLGIVFIRRTADNLASLAAAASPDRDRILAAQRRLRLLNMLNLLLLSSAVWAMVFKPTLS